MYDNWDVNYRASTVDGFYKTYKFVVDFGRSGKIYDLCRHYKFQWNGLWKEDIYKWCYRQHLKSNVRVDWHSVSKRDDKWVIDHCFGEDRIFTAFNNEEDSLMFQLAWS